MYLAWIFMELWLIEDTHYRCPGARQWRRVLFCLSPSNHTKLLVLKLKNPMAEFQFLIDYLF